MKKIKNYQEFTNEELNWKQGLAGAALGASLLNPNISNSQIDKVVVNTNPSNKVIVKKQIYDGGTNRVKENIETIIGETLYYPSYAPKFYVSLDELKNDIPEKDKNKSSYIGIGKYVGKFSDEFKDQSFTLTNVFKDSLHPSMINKDDFQLESDFYFILELKNKNTGKIFYQRYNSELNYPYFIIMKHFEFLRSSYVNSILKVSEIGVSSVKFELFRSMDFIGPVDTKNYRKASPMNHDFEIKDIKTGSTLDNSILIGEWKCENLVLDEKGNLCLLFTKDEFSFLYEYENIYSNNIPNSKVLKILSNSN